MLALVHIRINQNPGPHRQLDSLDPVRTSAALKRCPPVTRTEGIISAVLYATHALKVPVRFGPERIARGQYFFWTVHHSLSGFECAVILSQKLSFLAGTMGSETLTGKSDCDTESHILQ
ncbi:hypothetical protein VUR80DRAFT_6040 [Thermomyces stellatus]